MKVIIGDLFESRADVLVNTVNCVGVMGKGIAAVFKKKYPAMFADYAARCRSGLVKLGTPYLYPITFLRITPQIIFFHFHKLFEYHLHGRM